MEKDYDGGYKVGVRDGLMKMWPRYIVVDKYGWPVVGIIGRPIVSILRKIIHGRGFITRERWIDSEMKRMFSNSNAVSGEAAKNSN